MVDEDGRITPAAGSPFPAQAAGPVRQRVFAGRTLPACTSRTRMEEQATDRCLLFNVTHGGALSSIGSSPFADGQTAPCWVEISHDGAYLFTVNTASTTISSYRILADGSLSLVTSTAFKSGTGIRPFDARLSADGSTLYVVDAAIAKVSAFAVSRRLADRARPVTVRASLWRDAVRHRCHLTGFTRRGSRWTAAPYYAARNLNELHLAWVQGQAARQRVELARAARAARSGRFPSAVGRSDAPRVARSVDLLHRRRDRRAEAVDVEGISRAS